MIYTKPISLRKQMRELPMGGTILLGNLAAENTARNYASVLKDMTGREYFVHLAEKHIEITRTK